MSSAGHAPTLLCLTCLCVVQELFERDVECIIRFFRCECWQVAVHVGQLAIRMGWRLGLRSAHSAPRPYIAQCIVQPLSLSQQHEPFKQESMICTEHSILTLSRPMAMVLGCVVQQEVGVCA